MLWIRGCCPWLKLSWTSNLRFCYLELGWAPFWRNPDAFSDVMISLISKAKQSILSGDFIGVCYWLLWILAEKIPPIYSLPHREIPRDSLVSQSEFNPLSRYVGTWEGDRLSRSTLLYLHITMDPCSSTNPKNWVVFLSAERPATNSGAFAFPPATTSTLPSCREFSHSKSDVERA